MEDTIRIFTIPHRRWGTFTEYLTVNGSPLVVSYTTEPGKLVVHSVKQEDEYGTFREVDFGDIDPDILFEQIDARTAPIYF